jgi:exonuclease SbcC
MRILAIRGENLASLGRPFSIDFETEPLAGTGLFAITGETGSGKSTILDALCLALYGAYPRFSESQQDALPDPSGAKASISDGATILRRGAGSGYAEVDFVGQDTQRYRARWEARRARKKPDGAIQGALRSLHVVQGSTLTPVANSKTEVLRIVEMQTGLTFEQFCRTVLLPQGEFDSFLLAQRNERGALLEKITGTEIYGRISKIVYEGTRKLRADAEQLETELSNLGLLSSEERTTIEQAIAALEQEVATKTGEQRAWQARISHFDNITQAQQRQAAAEQALREARETANLAAPDRTRLRMLQIVEPLRSLRERQTLALGRKAPAELRDEQAKATLRQTQLDANSAKSILVTARAENDAAETTFRNFGPIWDEAARLDVERTTAQTEARTAHAAADTACKNQSALETELGGVTEQLGRISLELESAAASLEARSVQFPIADQFNQIEALFARYTSNATEAQLFKKHQKTAEGTAAKLRESLAACVLQVETETGLQRTASDAAQATQRKLDESDEAKWQTEEADLTTLLENARNLDLLAGWYRTATATLKSARAEHEAATTAIADAAARFQSAESCQLEQSNRRAEIQRNADLVKESLDQRSAHLRSLLIDGEHCPICGATEHPYTAPGTKDALTELAEKFRKERVSIDEALALSGRNLQRTTADRTAAEGRAQNEQRNETQAKGEIQSSTGEFRALRSATNIVCAKFDLGAFLPETLTEGTEAVDLIGQLAAKAQERRTLAHGQVTAIQGLRRQLDAANTANREAQKRLNAAVTHRDAAKASLHEAELQVVSATEGATQATARLRDTEAELTPFLDAARISVDSLRGNAAAALVSLRGTASEIASLCSRTAELSAQKDQLTGRQKELEASRQALAERGREADADVTRRDETLRQVSEARAQLLDGEETGPHRTRINAERLRAQNALQSAQASHSSLAAQLAAAGEHEKNAAAELAQSLTEIGEAERAYCEGCASAEIETTRADELLATTTNEKETLQTRLETLDRAVQNAEATLEERLSILQGLLTAESESLDRASLAAALDQLTAELNLASQNIGDRKGRLNHDDGLRITAADLRRRAEEKATELGIWQQVEDAIGSANGDRFRTFAQSLTLDQLVELANEHLESFSRRYQLFRSPDAELSLHVVDIEMGEEHRAIRSLSGGERFLVSLSLALALSGLDGHQFSVDTLFIDEGFGALDAETLDVAITALETLHGRGRKVGVITHVAAMIESIPVQIKVDKLGAGSSKVRVQAAGG